MKAVAYCRISPEEKAEGTNLIEDQKAIIDKYCAENNVELAGYYIDESGAGLRDKRPELDRLLNGDVPEHTEAVLVSSTGTIALNHKRYLFLSLELEKQNLKIVCVDPNADIFSNMMGGACRGAGA
ncbi:hypothetical protein C1878_15480 [Gordonibacter sp. 28C]|uniref:recombinase family protein n=1 Tax=Gordonibacter sp. 28C TaxID=2078569 RepID=UPI000DF7BE58|nr:recombinase family protein [Gordonibacter sp. 28C]RDB59301.1 hypothetical protein C1878_15480 [Gordonibacter sp. 28C]